EPFTMPTLEVRCDYLATDRRIPLPSRTASIDLPAPSELGQIQAQHNGVLVLDGKGCLKIATEQIALPDGTLTLECWLRGDTFSGRRGLITKPENSEYGLFCSDGTIDFSVFLGSGYVSAKSEEAVLRAGTWHHVAGVFDGKHVRVYVD